MKRLNFDSHFSEICTQSLSKKSALVWIVAWRQLGDKPLSDPVRAKSGWKALLIINVLANVGKRGAWNDKGINIQCKLSLFKWMN